MPAEFRPEIEGCQALLVIDITGVQEAEQKIGFRGGGQTMMEKLVYAGALSCAQCR